jgi:hypothetical protein
MQDSDDKRFEASIDAIRSLTRDGTRWRLELTNGELVSLETEELLTFKRVQSAILRNIGDPSALLPHISPAEWITVLQFFGELAKEK